MIDDNISGLLGLDCSGGGTIILTANSGVASQAWNAIFVLSGALPNNTTILWPQNVTGEFEVVNNTTAAFTVTLGVNNGSGGAAGATVVIPQGSTAGFYTDGTNVVHISGFLGGLFTPTDSSGAALALVSPVGYYRKIPGSCTIWGSCTYPATANGNAASLGSLPFQSANLTIHDNGFQGIPVFSSGAGTPGAGLPYSLIVTKNSTNMVFRQGGGANLLNSDLATYNVDFQATYPTVT